MVTAVNRPRVATPDRWQKALERAIENGSEVFIVADTGERMVTSASKFDVLHRADSVRCTCEAALAGDPVCQHRAVVRSILGWFDPTETEPAMVDCGACNGRGWQYIEIDGGRSFPSKADCRRCHGSGRMPVRIRMLALESSLSVVTD